MAMTLEIQLSKQLMMDYTQVGQVILKFIVHPAQIKLRQNNHAMEV